MVQYTRARCDVSFAALSDATRRGVLEQRGRADASITSDEGTVTTVTFAEKGGKTLLVMRELYPSKKALDAAGTGRRMRWESRSRNWTSSSSPWPVADKSNQPEV
jgi:hypothetical protein